MRFSVFSLMQTLTCRLPKALRGAEVVRYRICEQRLNVEWWCECVRNNRYRTPPGDLQLTARHHLETVVTQTIFASAMSIPRTSCPAAVDVHHQLQRTREMYSTIKLAMIRFCRIHAISTTYEQQLNDLPVPHGLRL